MTTVLTIIINGTELEQNGKTCEMQAKLVWKLMMEHTFVYFSGKHNCFP